jgi:hypothetical protein
MSCRKGLCNDVVPKHFVITAGYAHSAKSPQKIGEWTSFVGEIRFLLKPLSTGIASPIEHET